MKQVLRIFFGAEGTRPWLVLACLVLASLSEALGIGTLLPAANAILGDGPGSANGTNPKVLMLDEVTSALDPDMEAEIVSSIASLRGRCTITAITHRPAWTKIADRLYTVTKGHVSSSRQPTMQKRKKRWTVASA